MKRGLGLPCLILLTMSALPVLADEGMWPFNNVPSAYLQKTYGWAPDQAWLDHVRLASVRFNSGGSGAFVSETGLVLTNHHVGAGCIQKIRAPSTTTSGTATSRSPRPKRSSAPTWS